MSTTSTPGTQPAGKRTVILGQVFSLMAAVAYGSTAVLVRRGVTAVGSPLVGATISLVAGTLMLGLLGLRRPEKDLGQKKRAIGFLVISGILSGLGVLANFFAMSLAPVVIVSPLEAVSPVFALLWSSIFLKQLEKVTPRVIVGTLLVVAGVVLITLGRNL